MGPIWPTNVPPSAVDNIIAIAEDDMADVADVTTDYATKLQ